MASYFRLFAYRKFVSLQYGNDFYNSEKKVYQALFGILCVCVCKYPGIQNQLISGNFIPKEWKVEHIAEILKT